MRRTLWLKVQLAVLIAGAVLTGVMTAANFYQYLVIGGDLAQFRGTPLANPFTTPAFYATIGFVVAARLAWLQLTQPKARVELAVGALALAGAVLSLV